MALYLGIDTSNYTTSVAAFDPQHNTYKSYIKPLPVPTGTLGLRQSDAVFAHTKALPDIIEKVSEDFDLKSAVAIGVSTKPREAPGSYMPCFLTGITAATLVSKTLGIPCFEFSHQQGHIIAALYMGNRLELLKKEFLAWHLSGGTTELLRITPLKNHRFTEQIIGGTTDISAGQLIDRSGVMLGLDFPSGKAIDELASLSKKQDFFPVRVKDSSFSLSGMQNQVQKRFAHNTEATEIAYFVLSSISKAVLKATNQAFRKYSEMPVVMSGGVSGNRLLKSVLSEIDTVFAPPEYSSDNALGVAVYTAILSGGYDI